MGFVGSFLTSGTLTAGTTEAGSYANGSYSIGTVVYDEGSPDEYQARHIARHDPARVLREVEAKRAILALREASPVGSPVLTFALCHLAAVYSGHTDYDPAWAPAATIPPMYKIRVPAGQASVRKAGHD